jgi:hypothetical protein
MKVSGLDGRTYSWTFPEPRTRKCSGPHERARSVLKAMFPSQRVYEEVDLPGCPTRLTADFVLPRMRLIVEVQGEQHYEHNEFFHGTAAGFERHKQRDGLKRDWAERNGFNFAELDARDEPGWEQCLRDVLAGRQ